MRETKRLKDPVYGYIEIPTDYVKNIIDTPVYQRLRRIVQTSYSPLYPAAVHNRFIHSLGVFHLGELAAKSLLKEAANMKINEFDFENTARVFLLACLMHDIGHAPFSHSGESYYLDGDINKNSVSLHDSLCILVDSDEFRNDLPGESKSAAPHEIMSAIIGLKNFKSYFTSVDDKELFARCITGYKYSVKTSDASLKNCFISLLNSKIIDVDRLDYLLRDAFFTGFDTVKIDYQRLLSSLTLVTELQDKVDIPYIKYELAYYKWAISVIEDVVYAHDAERKWIQTHPVILYDTYLIQHIIQALNTKYNHDAIKLFSEESLSEKGLIIAENIKVSLLCDDDIIFLMKNIDDNQLIEEYFNRQKRRHPLWKSESEYKALFEVKYGNGNLFSSIKDAINETVKYLHSSHSHYVINDEIIAKVEAEYELIETDESLDHDSASFRIQKRTKEKILKFMHALQKYSKDNEIICNYVVLEASQFSSSFNKLDFSDINIVFKSTAPSCKFKDVVNSLAAGRSGGDKYYYIFYQPDMNKSVDVDGIRDAIAYAFLN